MPTAHGKQHQDLNPDPVNSKTRVSQLSCSLEEILGHCFLFAAVVLCGAPHSQKTAFPASPILPGSLLPLPQLFQPKRPLAAPASSPANPSSLSPALCTLGLQPAVGVGWGRESEALKATGQLASAQKGDMGKHCFFGDFYLINLTKSSLFFFFVPQIHSWQGINPLLAVSGACLPTFLC